MGEVREAVERDDDDDIIRVPEVARMTGAPQGSVRYWDSTGVGPPSFKLQGRRVYRRGAVRRWIEQQEQAAADQRGGGDAA
ncbi:helix-turn-helix transcriptional regulator [Mycolicibacterium grossiae]|uniref:helix-turn-helix transcriptional regulator n=1 Tax=Mycolicibacterium grossiae TaxID=1552759 RepID=UPI0009F27D29|nr:helix-turn-helix domain-containing protein [Mycolicibacterium grossiae]